MRSLTTHHTNNVNWKMRQLDDMSCMLYCSRRVICSPCPSLTCQVLSMFMSVKERRMDWFVHCVVQSHQNVQSPKRQILVSPNFGIFLLFSISHLFILSSLFEIVSPICLFQNFKTILGYFMTNKKKIHKVMLLIVISLLWPLLKTEEANIKARID